MLLAALLCARLSEPDITLDIDAKQAQYGLVHTHETLVVKPGTLTLSYPKWHPGNHRPTGPNNNMLNHRFSANGQTIPWKRDDVELFRFNLDIPSGVTKLDVEFDDAAEAGSTFTPHLARLQWNRFLLYPTGRPSADITVQAEVSVPQDGTLATPLLKIPTGGNHIPLRTCSLTELVDSPGLAGKYFKRVDLGTNESLNIAAETADGLAIKPETVAGSMRLVEEANALFGARHYRHYDFLVSASNGGAFLGLEHHECSEDGGGLGMFTTPAGLLDYGGLVAHEYAHSWNGKYRRPAGLATPTYDDPMKGDLLWVYEGMTQFWGQVLSARCGLATPQEFRQEIAESAADLSFGGRDWRTVEDTAISVSVLRGVGGPWRYLRRGLDYYSEAVFTWLEVDSIIRKQTANRKSIDDFCKLFHGGKSGPPAIRPYTLDEVIATLNAVAPYDWAGLLKERMATLQPKLSLAGLENEGWRLVWDETPDPAGRRPRTFAEYYAIGATFAADGKVNEALPPKAAYQAGLRPGMKVLTVNGEKFDTAKLTAALKSHAEFDLSIEYGGETRTIHIPYSAGLKYPHLVRIEGVPDQLSELASHHAK